MHIKLPRIIRDSRKIDKWSDLWNNAQNATYSIPNDLSVGEIRKYFKNFISRLPDNFASAILSEIAELENTPHDLLEMLFEKGDTSSMVSICCRPDLPDNILKQCLNSFNPDVLEHVVFHKKVSLEDCEKLLQRHLESSTIRTIRRAISQKKKNP